MSQIRRAEIDDARVFNTLLNSQGGQALFRATFGQFNFSNLVEYSYFSIICDVCEESCTGFASFNDANSINGEFDTTIETLQNLFACRVSVIPSMFNNFFYKLVFLTNEGDKYNFFDFYGNRY